MPRRPEAEKVSEGIVVGVITLDLEQEIMPKSIIRCT